MLKGILSISGKPGLYKMVSQGKNNIIVESLIDGKRFPAHSFEKIISLEDIAIFTETEDMPLIDVFKAIIKKEGEGAKSLNPKKASSEQLKAYFKEIIPEYDTDRVYVSDMKKVFSWYNLLIEKDLLKEDANSDVVEKEDKPEVKE
jgi:hypothetical protein